MTDTIILARVDDNAVLYRGKFCDWAEVDGKVYNVGPFLWEFTELVEMVRGLPYGSVTIIHGARLGAWFTWQQNEPYT